MYRCEFFMIRELVPPWVYEAKGDAAWELLDDRALITLDRLRRRFGPIVVNNWHNGGPRISSGLRTPECEEYSPTSQHTFGRAFDCISLDVRPRTMVTEIVRNPDDPTFEFITAVEDVEGWLHFDARNCRRIKFFRP